jgi:hypothetical protein
MQRWSIAVRAILYLQRCDRGSLLAIGLELPAMLLSRGDRIASESELGALPDLSPQTADKRKLSGPPIISYRQARLSSRGGGPRFGTRNDRLARSRHCRTIVSEVISGAPQPLDPTNSSLAVRDDPDDVS